MALKTYQTGRPTTNTTGATETTAASFATRSNKVYHVDVTVTAVRTDTFEQAASYVRRATFLNDGGTLAIVGSVTSDHTAESDSNWNCTLDASGTDIRVRVTGAADTNISWHVDGVVRESGNYVANYGIVEG
jgi:hypothetical protein